MGSVVAWVTRVLGVAIVEGLMFLVNPNACFRFLDLEVYGPLMDDCEED